MATQAFRVIAEVPVRPGWMPAIYEHGWQSWSPAGWYDADLVRSPRPRRPEWQVMAFRPDRPGPHEGFQSEGLLAIADAPDSVRAWVADDPTGSIPSIRVERVGQRLVVKADGAVRERPPASSPDQALADLGSHLAATIRPSRPARSVGPGWCSWYGYGPDVTDPVVDANLAVIEAQDLDARVIQIDDGHQAEIGDWLSPSGRIRSMAALAARITGGGREAGVWTAPFMVGTRSDLARRHPDWLVGDAVAAPDHWGQEVRVLDVTHPDAADHLVGVFRTLRTWGYTFHKIDFLYAGAMPGRRYADVDPIGAYREGLRLIRMAVGDDAILLGCGAPLLASIGLVDAMRISPDTDRRMEPPDGDISQPSMRAAMTAGRARAWMHGRLWVNDPDCLIADPRSDDREAWASHLRSSPGLAMTGDRLPDLDVHGLDLTRAFLGSLERGRIA